MGSLTMLGGTFGRFVMYSNTVKTHLFVTGLKGWISQCPTDSGIPSVMRAGMAILTLSNSTCTQTKFGITSFKPYDIGHKNSRLMVYALMSPIVLISNSCAISQHFVIRLIPISG